MVQETNLEIRAWFFFAEKFTNIYRKYTRYLNGQRIIMSSAVIERW